MNEAARAIFWMLTTIGLTVLAGAFVFVMPSLIGLLIGAILVLTMIDISSRRRQVAVRTFNSAVRAVCRHEGAVSKLAVAYSRGGPLAGPCYEYARRLMMGEHPVDAAAIARVPLQLSTAVALESPAGEDADGSYEPPEYETTIRDSSSMPAYAQLMYLTMTACVTGLVLTFISLFIVPSFEQMFDEFGLDLQYEMLLDGTPVILSLAMMAVLTLAFVALINSGRLLGPRRFGLLPMMPGMSQRKAETLHGLADAVDAGWPIGRALAVGHTIALRKDQRQALELAMQLIERGMSPAEAIHQAGFVSAVEASWLADAGPQRTGELLRVIADQNVRDARSNLRWMMSIFFPLVILLLGSAVMAFSYGFFGTLMELISGLS